MMLHVPDVLNAEQVHKIRAALDDTDWVDGRETVGDQVAQVKRNRQLPEQSPSEDLFPRQRGQVRAHRYVVGASRA